jgi:hypothetical protein
MDQAETGILQFQTVMRSETYPVRNAGEVPKQLERILNDPGFGEGGDLEERKLAYLVRTGDLLHGMILSGREARQFLKRSEGNFPAVLIRNGLGKMGILIRDAAVPKANAVLTRLGLEQRFRQFPEKAPDGSGPEGPGQETPGGTEGRAGGDPYREAPPPSIQPEDDPDRLRRLDGYRVWTIRDRAGTGKDAEEPARKGETGRTGTLERIRTAVPRELTAREQLERLQRENDRRRARKREEACHMEPEGIVPLEMSRLEREWNDL